MALIVQKYGGTSVADAEGWLRPLVALQVSDLSMSDDAFHGGDAAAPVQAAIAAAKRLELPVNVIRVDGPTLGGGANLPGARVRRSRAGRCAYGAALSTG